MAVLYSLPSTSWSPLLVLSVAFFSHLTSSPYFFAFRGGDKTFQTLGYIHFRICYCCFHITKIWKLGKALLVRFCCFQSEWSNQLLIEICFTFYLVQIPSVLPLHLPIEINCLRRLLLSTILKSSFLNPIWRTNRRPIVLLLSNPGLPISPSHYSASNTLSSGFAVSITC